MANRVGQQLGNYRLTRLLGSGGFAEVYLGEHIYLKSEAANKVWYVDLTQSSVTLQQVAVVATSPASAVRLSSSNLFPLLVSTGGEIDAVS